MLQMPLNLTRSSRLWTFQLLGFEVSSLVTKKKPRQPFLTQRRDFPPFEDKNH
jgi:hypothetical protein